MMPPYYVKIWLWLIAKANYQDGKRLKRGECFVTIEETRQQTKYMVGYRSEMESTKTVRRVYEWLTERSMIVTTKVTNGSVVKLLQYEQYQTFENHEGTYEGPTKVPTKGQRKSLEGQNISYKENKELRTKNKEGEHATVVAASPKKQVSIDAQELTQDLWKRIQANNEYAREPNLEKWAEEMDKILRIDKRDRKALEFLIKWSQQDSFWSTNILSPIKLRKHFEKLFLNAKQEWQQKEKNRIPSFD